MFGFVSKKAKQELLDQQAELLAERARLDDEKKILAQRSSGFSAADYSRLTSSMQNESEHIMRMLRYQGKTLRARARQVTINTAYGAKFLQLVVSNVCGPTPFKLQAKVKYSSGKFDTTANQRLESEWAQWSKPGKADFEGRLSLADILRLVARTLACDGEALIRIHEGTQAGPWGLQLQVIDVDRLDEDLNKELTNGNVIIAGVELDTNGRTVAYHLLKRKPSDWQFGYSREYIRIPSEQMIHLYMPMYAEQVRGVPWLYAAILKLHEIGAFEEAALIAARVGASKMGFYQNTGAGDPNFGAGGVQTPDGDFVSSCEPGEFEKIPTGWEMKEWNPNYPDAQVGPFLKSLIRGVASGCGVSYNSLASDLESVNFSSMRSGLLEEREYWMMIQQWMIEHFLEPLYERWLLNSLLRRKMPFPLERSEKYLDVIFQPRRWQWVDPLKDVRANIEAIQWGLKSRTAVITESGGDIEDVFDQLKMEEELAASKKVGIVPASEQGDANGQQPDADQDGE